MNNIEYTVTQGIGLNEHAVFKVVTQKSNIPKHNTHSDANNRETNNTDHLNQSGQQGAIR